MTSFLLALQFLTIIPVRIKRFDESEFAKSITFFPIIGLLLAFILISINGLFFSMGFNYIATAIIVIVSLTILTRGMHIDGLSDTCDALFSSKPREEMLEIMRDSCCGAMGVLSVICIVLLKISFLFSISTGHRAGAIILMCVLSRWSLVFLVFLFPYARTNGKGKAFSEKINSKMLMIASIFSLFCAILVFKVVGLFIIIPVVLVAYLFGKLMNKKIGGITGDTLGAANELLETVVLLSVCLLERAGLGWIM